MAQGRFTLDFHKGFIIVHIKHGSGRVGNLKDDHSSDFDRVAVDIVDFQPFAVEIAYPQGHFFGNGERGRHPDAALPDTADIGTEKGQDRRVIG
ncbi:hypothetical protein SDC9_202810 [bioreactor metagenome]|uniref:Uncharacterized protein n=1 Tax=bioreactor metagenome TaxID=1076179 RepID=A0A645IUP3_9ZZZZ